MAQVDRTLVRELLDMLASSWPCCACCDGDNEYIEVVMKAFLRAPKEHWPAPNEQWHREITRRVEAARAEV